MHACFLAKQTETFIHNLYKRVKTKLVLTQMSTNPSLLSSLTYACRTTSEFKITILFSGETIFLRANIWKNVQMEP